MKKYKHKQTGITVYEKEHCYELKEESNNDLYAIPKEFIETSSDWEEITHEMKIISGLSYKNPKHYTFIDHMPEDVNALKSILVVNPTEDVIIILKAISDGVSIEMDDLEDNEPRRITVD